MQLFTEIISTSMTLHLYLVVIIAVLYLAVHHYRNRPSLAFLDIFLNYIPVLTHEFGHIVFNKISGGHTEDLVIVTSSRERVATSQQGFAITRASRRSTMIITTLGGYVMPPLMLAIGIFSAYYHFPALFVLSYLVIFIYFICITSRKGIPILIALILGIMIYLLIQNNQPDTMILILTIVYHFILGVLFGELLQSSWTILRLTFTQYPIEWDGTALRNLTHIPVVAFSTLWIAFNFYIVYAVVKYLLFQS